MATSRARRQASKNNARRVKQVGGGSSGTAPRQSAGLIGTLGRIGGGIVGGLIGGPGGAAAGSQIGERIGESFEGGSDTARGFTGPGPCPEGRIRVGNNCIDPLALPPGGSPAVVPASGTQIQGGGQAVMGSFGLPAMAPRVEARTHRSCGPGMVLGKDNLCYPRGILSRRSKFRKWRQPPRPPVTSGDVKAIRRAARAKDRVKDLAKDVGFRCKKR